MVTGLSYSAAASISALSRRSSPIAGTTEIRAQPGARLAFPAGVFPVTRTSPAPWQASWATSGRQHEERTSPSRGRLHGAGQ